MECELAKAWNDKYEWPKIRIATAKEFLKYVAENHENDFETLRVAWPDWWSDGCGASAREVAATRVAQTDLIANSAGLTMAAIQGAKLS